MLKTLDFEHPFGMRVRACAPFFACAGHSMAGQGVLGRSRDLTLVPAVLLVIPMTRNTSREGGSLALSVVKECAPRERQRPPTTARAAKNGPGRWRVLPKDAGMLFEPQEGACARAFLLKWGL